jgi:tRNA threonylcarbamoyladenosine biosynthesis protein TsaE
VSDVLVASSDSADDTLALGAALGRLLAAGDFVALSGPLGAGKTQFVKGLARGLGVPDDEPVVSPTFVLVREYAGRLRLYHLDLYRLHGAGELADLGVDELRRSGGAVVAVEWADRAPDAIPTEAWCVALAHVGPSRRTITASHPDAGRIERLRAAWAR